MFFLFLSQMSRDIGQFFMPFPVKRIIRMRRMKFFGKIANNSSLFFVEISLCAFLIH
jgi:hypothetical protein